jgi:hypothetical protein
VDVVRHPAIREYLHSILHGRLGQECLKAQEVAAIAKDRLPVIAPENGVVQTAADVKPTLPWH